MPDVALDVALAVRAVQAVRAPKPRFLAALVVLVAGQVAAVLVFAGTRTALVAILLDDHVVQVEAHTKDGV